MSDRSGRVAPGFEAVRDAFEANFTERDDIGAACCVYQGGELVVDLWGGTADVETGSPWQEDTLALVFSTTKGVTATCAHLLVERGELDVDAPVAEYWPEFGAAGKEDVPVRWLLSHQVGLPVIDGDFTLGDALAWDPVVSALAAQAPVWQPGTAHGYHLRSWGWLVGELVRRVSGRTLGRFLADEVAGPLGLEFWVGLPEEEEARCASVVPPRGEYAAVNDLVADLPDDHVLGRATTGPSDLFRYDEMWNSRELHAAELPSSNGIGDARSVARLYASLIGEVDGLRVLRPSTVEAATTLQARGPDEVIMVETAYALGYMVPPMLPPAAGPRSFGHPGAGGSVGFADPDAGIAFAYVMNDLRFELAVDQRSASLVDAVYRSL